MEASMGGGRRARRWDELCKTALNSAALDSDLRACDTRKIVGTCSRDKKVLYPIISQGYPVVCFQPC